MSNRPKRGKGLHMLDQRRRDAANRKVEQTKRASSENSRIMTFTGKATPSRYVSSNVFLAKINLNEPIGLFLDDERFPDQVERCRGMGDSIQWVICRAVEEGVEFLQTCIEKNIKLSMVTLDWDLSMSYPTYTGLTGESFLDRFWDIVRDQVHKESFPINMDDFMGLYIHSQAHSTVLESMHRKRRDFTFWLHSVRYGQKETAEATSAS